MSIEINQLEIRSPNFGGLWETVVKSLRHYLRGTVGKTKILWNNLKQLLSKFEGILDSCPLVLLSDSIKNIFRYVNFMLHRFLCKISCEL